MKKFALLLLVLPLSACATSPTPMTVSQGCVPASHWEMATGCGAFAAAPGQTGSTANPAAGSWGGGH